MGVPISIRLDDFVKTELETQAQAKGVGLSTYLRDIATEAAREARRARIRADTERIARYVESSPEAKEFFEFWGTPDAEIWGRL